MKKLLSFLLVLTLCLGLLASCNGGTPGTDTNGGADSQNTGGSTDNGKNDDGTVDGTLPEDSIKSYALFNGDGFFTFERNKSGALTGVSWWSTWGRVMSMGILGITYDSEGRLSQARFYPDGFWGGETSHETVDFTVETDGSYVAESAGGSDHVKITVDDGGKIATVMLDISYLDVLQFTFGSDGLVTKLDAYGEVVFTYTYTDNVVNIVMDNYATETESGRVTVTYNEDGYPLEMVYQEGGEELRNTWTYDAAGWCDSCIGDGEEYTFNANGDPLTYIHAWRSYDQNGNILEEGKKVETFEYDAEGNRIKQTVATYDKEGVLISQEEYFEQ